MATKQFTTELFYAELVLQTVISKPMLECVTAYKDYDPHRCLSKRIPITLTRQGSQAYVRMVKMNTIAGISTLQQVESMSLFLLSL